MLIALYCHILILRSYEISRVSYYMFSLNIEEKSKGGSFLFFLIVSLLINLFFRMMEYVGRVKKGIISPLYIKNHHHPSRSDSFQSLSLSMFHKSHIMDYMHFIYHLSLYLVHMYYLPMHV